jgi:hypothetical protein
LAARRTILPFQNAAMSRRSIIHFVLALHAWIVAPGTAFADAITRSDALRIAETYVQHRWSASATNLRHGTDASGIEVHTPDRAGGHGDPAVDCWLVDAPNTGIAYKWGGFDTPTAFDAGIRKGKAAGDVYTPEKRRKGGAAVSAEAVGIDCSGFVSRCWNLSEKHSTSMLFAISQRLPAPEALQPADIMNTAEGHVLLFVRWLDAEKTRALFYESAPYSKTRASERELAALTAAGYVPLRYRKIRD